MKNPKWFKFKMEDEMRCRLKGIAKRRKYHAPDLVRLLVDRLIAYENDPHVVDLTVWSNTVNKAAMATSKATRALTEPAHGEEDEVDRARREGWASPKFGRR